MYVALPCLCQQLAPERTSKKTSTRQYFPTKPPGHLGLQDFLHQGDYLCISWISCTNLSSCHVNSQSCVKKRRFFFRCCLKKLPLIILCPSHSSVLTNHIQQNHIHSHTLMISVISYSFLCFPELRVQIISPLPYGSHSTPVIILAAFLCTSSSSVAAPEMEGPGQQGTRTAQSIKKQVFVLVTAIMLFLCSLILFYS